MYQSPTAHASFEITLNIIYLRVLYFGHQTSVVIQKFIIGDDYYS